MKDLTGNNISITDMQGRKVYASSFGGNQLSFKCCMKPGVYYIKVNIDNVEKIKKYIVVN